MRTYDIEVEELRATYLLTNLPPTRAPSALPTGPGTTCNAAMAFDAFSVRAK